MCKIEKNWNFPFGLYLINVYLQTEKIQVLENFKCFFFNNPGKSMIFFLNSKCTSGVCNENLVFGRAGLLSVKYTTDLKDLIQK